ncbi:MAG: hypothetical protein IIY78_00900 [Clostridia bacterium]|nr:hypothetical protein [Clostridia bacterium]
MNVTSAWDNFTLSGSVADYLTYSTLKNGGDMDNENCNGRDCDQGADRQGVRQIDNSSDKK